MIIVLGSSIHFHKLVFEINFEIYVSNTDFSLVSSLFAEEKKKKKSSITLLCIHVKNIVKIFSYDGLTKLTFVSTI